MSAERVARHNGFGPEVITFVLGTAQTLSALPGDLTKVDVIVCNWLGYCLLYEARLDEFLTARDRWLRPGGCLLPDKASLHVALLKHSELEEQEFDYKGVWGFDFTSMRPGVVQEPVVGEHSSSDVLSSPARILELDLYHCSTSDCWDFAASFQLRGTRPGVACGLLLWFEVHFRDGEKEAAAIVTAPWMQPTCWRQTALKFNGEPMRVHPGAQVNGMLALRKPHEHRRDLDIRVRLLLKNAEPRDQAFHWS
eukprot:TRINITY_DN30489_c0_g2_i1.p1 TRINITY_DN30489_c0_g2~~TRINITY_DN30489_c0_g2_i1.p1  ORF type:complete len:288 (-),score=66.49 TRINITY_DN30489_c0_g2_i1:43-798(-)